MAQGIIKPVTADTILAIEMEMDNFLLDARKLTNKAAASRARVTSMKLEKLFKAYRVNSIKASFKK